MKPAVAASVGASLFLNFLQGSGTTGLSFSRLSNIKPKTSFCRVLGKLGPYMFVFDFVCVYLSLFVF